MDSKKKPVKKGVPVFDRETTENIVKEAMKSGNVAETARKHGTSEYNLYRWIRKYKSRTGLFASDDAKERQGGVVGAQYRVPPSQSDEVSRLQEELREAYATIGKLTVERDKLKGKT